MVIPIPRTWFSVILKAGAYSSGASTHGCGDCEVVVLRNKQVVRPETEAERLAREQKK